MQAIAVIGDIVASKDIKPREAFQRKLAKALAARGKARGSSLASPYTITLGDEFQAVYRAAGPLWADLVGILAEVHPVQIRFGIGIGELTTRLNAKQALGMDGPAFHRARAALTALKDTGTRFRIVGENEESWAIANRALAFLSHYLTGWSGNRLQVLAALLRAQTVSEFEPALPISKVAIYKNINAAALDEVTELCNAISRALDTGLRKR